MRNPIEQLLHPQSNVEEVVLRILRDSEVKATRDTVRAQLDNHPSFPSFAAVSDVLFTFGIESFACHIDNCQKLKGVNSSFLAQIRYGGKELFAVVYAITPSLVDWYNPFQHRRETIPCGEFENLYSGYVMFFDITGKKDEQGYLYRKSTQRARMLIDFLTFAFMPVCAALGIWQNASIFNFSIALLLLIGFIIGTLLLLYENLQENELLMRICSFGEHANCGDILHSDRSAVWGVPWAVIGTSYYMGSLLACSLSGFSHRVMTLFALLHVFTLLYAAYSIYYQAHVAKKWCPLCLTVQAVSMAVLCCLLIHGIYSELFAPDVSSIVIFTCSLLLSFLFAYSLWLLSSKTKNWHQAKKQLNQLKYDKNVFNALLTQGRKIEVPTDELGVVLGNPHGGIHIIQVCQLFCGHCAKAHPILQRIADNNSEVRLQIIFATPPDEKDRQNKLAEWFLSIADSDEDIEDVLADWYALPRNSIDSFMEKHSSLKGHIVENQDKIKKMHQFCHDVKIKGTPTVFINGYELPSSYKIEELLYILQ